MSYTNGLDKPSDYFNTVLYSGDGTSNRSITGVNFQPDLVWIKNRNNTNSHHLLDSVRGLLRLSSQDSAAEQDVSSAFKSFDSDGFTVTEEVNFEFNNSGKTYASWNWLASNTTASNTDGSITSTVSVNTTSGFSIVSYTGNGSATQTIGHGLGVSPSFIIIKNRDEIQSWIVGITSNVFTWSSDYLRLNLTDAKRTDGGGTLFSSAPTSSLINVGSNTATNGSGDNMIAYCFAEKKGFSKFGSYTGNGSTDGTFVYTGFKPAFLIIKRTDGAFSWLMFDNKRNTYNNVGTFLLPNSSDAEQTSTYVDFLSNGWKCRNTSNDFNASGGSYIYMAFAENPFVTSTGIPTTGR